MKRPAQNFLVDSLSFVAFVLLVATGVIMFFILQPGSHGATLWGLGRHDWGDIHFWIAVAFLVLVAVHLVLHWKWIVCMVEGRPRDGKKARFRSALAIVSVVALLALAAAPLFSATVEEAGRGQQGRGFGRMAQTEQAPTTLEALTLEDAAHLFGIPAEDLARDLGLPPRATRETLHQLADRHGLTLAEVRRAARAYVRTHALTSSP